MEIYPVDTAFHLWNNWGHMSFRAKPWHLHTLSSRVITVAMATCFFFLTEDLNDAQRDRRFSWKYVQLLNEIHWLLHNIWCQLSDYYWLVTMIGWFKKLLFTYTKRNSVITKLYGRNLRRYSNRRKLPKQSDVCHGRSLMFWILINNFLTPATRDQTLL